MQSKKETLNEDQLSAVSKFDEVIRTLELTKELEKQFIALANDVTRKNFFPNNINHETSQNKCYLKI